jgi:hypothetical protein
MKVSIPSVRRPLVNNYPKPKRLIMAEIFPNQISQAGGSAANVLERLTQVCMARAVLVVATYVATLVQSSNPVGLMVVPRDCRRTSICIYRCIREDLGQYRSVGGIKSVIFYAEGLTRETLTRE